MKKLFLRAEFGPLWEPWEEDEIGRNTLSHYEPIIKQWQYQFGISFGGKCPLLLNFLLTMLVKCFQEVKPKCVVIDRK